MNEPTRAVRCRFAWDVLEKDVLERFDRHSLESLRSLVIALLVILTKGVQEQALESVLAFIEQVWRHHAGGFRRSMTDEAVKEIARRKLNGKIRMLLFDGPNQFASGLVGLLVLVSVHSVEWSALKASIEETWNSAEVTALLERLEEFEIRGSN